MMPTQDERTLIFEMLRDGRISVDEAEYLFTSIASERAASSNEVAQTYASYYERNVDDDEMEQWYRRIGC